MFESVTGLMCMCGRPNVWDDGVKPNVWGAYLVCVVGVPLGDLPRCDAQRLERRLHDIAATRGLVVSSLRTLVGIHEATKGP